MFAVYVYYGTFNGCLQNFISTCSNVLLSKGVLYDDSSGSKVFYGQSNTGLYQGIIQFVAAAVLEKDRFIIEKLIISLLRISLTSFLYLIIVFHLIFLCRHWSKLITWYDLA